MVEREEVEKVHIRKGIVNKDGERLDVIVSKKTGIEYQPDIIGDKTEMWVWRLRQPQEAMDTSKVREMKQNPSPLHPREDCDSRSSRPTHPHGNTSPRSSFFQNTDKPPPWAGEYSAKRPARGHRQGGSMQPRFHMSWGTHWKGKSGAHGIHFSSALRSPLAEDAMSSPNPISVSKDCKDDARHSSHNASCAQMSQPTGYQAQKRGSIVDQLPRQHFDQPRDEKSLDSSGSFGSRRAQSHWTGNTSMQKHPHRRYSIQQRDNTNTPSYSGEWYGLTSRVVAPWGRSPRLHKDDSSDHSALFGLRLVQRDNENVNSLPDSKESSASPDSPEICTTQHRADHIPCFQPTNSHPSSSPRNNPAPSDPPIQCKTSVNENRLAETKRRESREALVHDQEDVPFGLKKPRPLHSHRDISASQTSFKPSRQPVNPLEQERRTIQEDDTPFGLKRLPQGQGHSKPDLSTSREPVQPTDRPRNHTWSEGYNVDVECEMSFGLKRSRSREGRSRIDISASHISVELETRNRSSDRSAEYMGTNDDSLCNSDGRMASFGLEKPQPPHRADKEQDFDTSHTIDQQTRRPGPSFEKYTRDRHLEGTSSEVPAHRPGKAPMHDEDKNLVGFSHHEHPGRSNPGISANRTFSEPSRLPGEHLWSARRLERTDLTWASSSRGNSIHAWEDASLKLMHQSGEPGDDTRAAFTRDMSPCLSQPSDRMPWRLRELVNTESVDSCLPNSSAENVDRLPTLSEKPRWYRRPDGGTWTFGLPKGLDAPSTTSTRQLDVSFSERLRQSRAAITEQVHKQLRSYIKPASGRLSQFQSQPIAQPRNAGQPSRTGKGFRPPIIRALTGAPNPRQPPPKKRIPLQPSHDADKFIYPSFPPTT